MEEILRKMIGWISRVHLREQYPTEEQKAGGERLARTIVTSLGVMLEKPGEPPAEPTDPPAEPVPDPKLGSQVPTWTATPATAKRLSDGVSYPINSLEDWYGASWWSSPAYNNQPLPGKKPGDRISLQPGDYIGFRCTLHCDIDVEALKLNPLRRGDPVNYPSYVFNYLNNDGTIRYGLNNRDHFKGTWTQPQPANSLEPAYPAWFKAGVDPITWFEGGDGGMARILGEVYIERSSAVGFEGIDFVGTGTSRGIIMTERPVGFDINGAPIPDQTNWPESPECVIGEWQTQRNLHFLRCVIEGGWDAHLHNHPPGVSASKWAIHTNQVGWSEIEGMPGFTLRECIIQGINWEHLQYHHNPRAKSDFHVAIEVSDCTMRWARRTAIQVVCRSGEGPVGRGRILIERTFIHDVCLEDQGGGSALTFAGRFDGVVEIRNVTCLLGCDEDLHPALQGNITGCFVSYFGGGSDGVPTREILVDSCHFEVGEYYQGVGSARRPNMMVGAVSRFSLFGTTVKQHPGCREAIVFDTLTIGQLVLDRNCKVFGDVVWAGRKYADPNFDGSGWNAMLSDPRFISDPKVTILD